MVKDIFYITRMCTREKFGHIDFPSRVNEPTMAMDIEEEIEAFKMASSPNGALAPIQLYSAISATEVIHGAKNVLELGCGTGHVLTKMAYLNPEIKFYALDLSRGMLERAKQLADSLGLKNIEFCYGDMTDLSQFEDKKIDAVVSSIALHHLRSESDLRKTISEARRIIHGEFKFAIIDVGRMKYEKSIYDLIALHNHNNSVLTLETVNSWKAAFLLEDFQDAFKNAGVLEKIQLQRSRWVTTFIRANTQKSTLPLEKLKRFEKLKNDLTLQNRFLTYIMRSIFFKN